MKNSWLVSILFLAIPLLSLSQDEDKVKGNRDVTIKQTYVDGFNKIVVGEDFTVEIIYNSKSSVEVETDDNLHEYININVVDSVLSFSTDKRITTKRKMNIIVNYNSKLKEIETKDDGEIRSLTSLELDNTVLKTSGTSKAYLNIKAKKFKLVSIDRSRLRLNVTADDSDIELSDNVRLEALINSPKFHMDLYQRSTADIEGTANEAVIRADNNSKFDGKNFTTTTCNLIAEIDSEVYIEVLEQINIEASGGSQIYLFNEPAIILNRFTDTAKLQKKTR